MTLIPELEHELEAAIARRIAESRAGSRAAAPPRPRRRRARGRLSRRGALVLVAALLLGAAAALAAGGVIPIGAPARDPGGWPAGPGRGNGTVLPGSLDVLPLRVADPVGGPAWGLRVTSTTRGTGCLQVGRAVGGRLGALGTDLAFGDDGRFHPFSAQYGVSGPCAQLDAAGRLFLTQSRGGIPAAATAQDGACVPPGEIVGDPTVHECAPADLRDLIYGTLGPHARSITYNKPDGTPATVPVARPWGAYLLVLPWSRTLSNGISGSLYGTDPEPLQTPITKVTFDDNSVCAVTPMGWADRRRGCPQVGLKPHPLPPGVTKASVRARVRAHTVPNHRTHRLDVVVSFRAPVALTNADALYEVTRKLRGARGWGSGTVNRDVRRGEVVTVKFRTARRGVYHGVVQYQFLAGTPRDRRVFTVGNYRFRVR
ncbi:hypothetical protein [Conexibacter woesei]|uniref:hypothetical protein n=1 Tax=Conexibacter woesei TaxID=191495 RepID=UPI000409C00F|nr:hypothetical protein [Conexibacter woesei]